MPKRILAVLLILVLLMPSAFADTVSLTETEQAALELLSEQREKSATDLIRHGGYVPDLYPDVSALTEADMDSLPEKFDLREFGVITSPKDQNPFGTCWIFGTIGASESGLLTAMGLTTGTFREKFGEDLDLSEHHLAWFTSTALTEESGYSSQAGEGRYMENADSATILDTGGNYFMTTSAMAAGMGPVPESAAPYTNTEGNADMPVGDWSLPETQRFARKYALKDSNSLPAPSSKDAEGHYVYRPEGTAVIKKELFKGRGVAVTYKLDTSVPEYVQTPEEKLNVLKSNIDCHPEISEEDADRYIAIAMGTLDPDTLTDDELWHALEIRCILDIYGDGGNPFDRSALSREGLIRVLTAKNFPLTPEQLDEMERMEAEAESWLFLNFVGEDPVIWAHYTDRETMANHAVLIVGWDDTFSASNFRRQPPGDGAWIVRNNNGDTFWGMEGYFYLSYYDMTLCAARTFVFEDGEVPEGSGILQHDLMPAQLTDASLFDTPVLAANVFSVGGNDAVLEAVSAVTGCMNTSVTAEVWLLKDGYTSPADGTLLATVTERFEYAGYHRITLPGKVLLPKGSVIGITVKEDVPTEGDIRYALAVSSGLKEKAKEAYSEFFPYQQMRYWLKGVINRGESFVSFEEGRWLDWRDVVDCFAENGYCAIVAYDNLPIKGYLSVPE